MTVNTQSTKHNKQQMVSVKMDTVQQSSSILIFKVVNDSLHVILKVFNVIQLQGLESYSLNNLWCFYSRFLTMLQSFRIRKAPSVASS